MEPLINLASLGASIGAGFRLAGEAGTFAPDASTAARVALDTEPKSVWTLSPIVRGKAIEEKLATTEYADWYYIGKENNGFFPLVDFQKDNTLLSLRTVNTNSSRWFARTVEHIEDLGSNGATIDGNLAKTELDLRVQPGGFEDAQPLVQAGKKKGVTVVIREYP